MDSRIPSNYPSSNPISANPSIPSDRKVKANEGKEEVSTVAKKVDQSIKPSAHPQVSAQKSVVRASQLPADFARILKPLFQQGIMSGEEVRKVLEKLEATYNQPLPRPQLIKKENEEPVCILWRGCRCDQLIDMVRTGSAGGKRLANANALPPTDESAKKQVGESESLPEFTTDTVTAEGFGTGNFVAVFAISQRYLTKGSGVESGLVASDDAPVELIAFKSGRPFVGLSGTSGGGNFGARRLVID